MNHLYFLEELYHSRRLSDRKVKKLKTALSNGRGRGKAAVVCLSFFEKDELDIIPVKEIKRRRMSRPGDYKIIGLGKNKDDAMEVVEAIVGDVLEKTGDVRLKEYFSGYFREDPV